MSNRYVPFGYEISDGEITVIEREKEVVRSIFSLYAQGQPLKQIAEKLNVLPIS